MMMMMMMLLMMMTIVVISWGQGKLIFFTCIDDNLAPKCQNSPQNVKIALKMNKVASSFSNIHDCYNV